MFAPANRPLDDMPRATLPSVHQMLVAPRSPLATVAVTPEGCVSWAEFSQRIADCRRELAALPKQRLLLSDSDPLDFSIKLLAMLAEGHVPVIPPNFLPATLADIGQRLAADALPQTPSIELYTSGSSGEPKRILKKLVQLEAECQSLEILWGNRVSGTTIVATVPHHHIYGLLFRLLWPLLAGRPFDTITAAEPATLVEQLTKHQDVVLISSPAHLARLPELVDLPHTPRKPRMVFSSGGQVATTVAKIFNDAWGAAPTEIFGSTETGGIAWRCQQQDSTAWMPIPGVTVDCDHDGALLVRSPFLPDDLSLRTEDAVEFLPDGRFVLRGRLDRIVKIEEKRLSLPEMESRLACHPLVKEAAVIPVTTAKGKRVVIGALVVPSPAGSVLLEKGRRELSSILANHLATTYDHVLLPRRWRFATQMPYNERGKLPLAVVASLFDTIQE